MKGAKRWWCVSCRRLESTRYACEKKVAAAKRQRAMRIITLDSQLQDVHTFNCTCEGDQEDRSCYHLRRTIRRIVVPERPRGEPR
jgi:hypothetical protein